ncbi:MAG: hypothetical protein RTU30_04765 [Candidatus Thorarchaeota archaeon]
MTAFQPRRAQTIVRVRGWSGLAEGLSMMNRQNNFLIRQKAVLESIDLLELVGIDAEVLPVLKKIPDITSWGEGRNLIREYLHEMIFQQIAEKGATMFFDIEHMMRTEAVILVSEILERRKIEVEETILKTDGESIRTMPLHLTFYGHRLLTTLRIYSSLPMPRLAELERAMEKLDLSITISESGESESVKVSNELRRHIFDGQLSIYVMSYIRQRYSECGEAVSVSEINAEFRALGFDLSEVTLQIIEDKTRGHIIENPVGHYTPSAKP